MGIVVRLLRAMPLVIALAVLAVVVYALVASLRSPDRAKEVLIKLFCVLTGALSAFFCLASAYAVFEANQPVLELASAFAAVSVLALGVVLVCRAVFLRRRPGYPWRKGRTGGRRLGR